MPLLLLAYWKQILGGVVAIGLLSYIAILKHEITHWHDAAIAAQTRLDSCTAQKLLLDTEVKDQNAAIARADAQARAQIAEASDSAKFEVIVAKQKTLQALAALHSSKVPRTCIKAIAHANVHAKELSTW